MNIYEKLNEARLRFQNAGVRKSGHNGFAGYDCYELSDILPAVNKIAADLKFTCAVSFGSAGELAITDSEKPEDRIVFATPMAEAQLKGCHPVQNLGAAETYLKRYLYQNAFEITESDALDGTMNPSDAAGNGRARAGGGNPGAAAEAVPTAGRGLAMRKEAGIRALIARMPPQFRKTAEKDLQNALGAEGESLFAALDAVETKVRATLPRPANLPPNA
ncbi:MAG: hypothetical protein Pg6C_11830 [Treponemataceae bacterium]|nr:MAG: hypothetical protein Pg6C_11830 [Treponemataceae bacterium]